MSRFFCAQILQEFLQIAISIIAGGYFTIQEGCVGGARFLYLYHHGSTAYEATGKSPFSNGDGDSGFGQAFGNHDCRRESLEGESIESLEGKNRIS
ncbi:MAG: hypothetical protein R3B93_23715 [Bacteroidia bacterium]